MQPPLEAEGGAEPAAAQASRQPRLLVRSGSGLGVRGFSSLVCAIRHGAHSCVGASPVSGALTGQLCRAGWLGLAQSWFCLCPALVELPRAVLWGRTEASQSCIQVLSEMPAQGVWYLGGAETLAVGVLIALAVAGLWIDDRFVLFPGRMTEAGRP